jgi:uncharacterized protein (DUF2147 family)
MHTRYRFGIGLLLAFILAATPVAAAPSPLGKWQISAGDSRYRVSKCGSRMCARMIWLRPDKESAKTAGLLNRDFVISSTPASPGQWTVQIKLDGNTYDGVLTMVSKNAMQVKCCAGFLCKTFNFTRI